MSIRRLGWRALLLLATVLALALDASAQNAAVVQDATTWVNSIKPTSPAQIVNPAAMGASAAWGTGAVPSTVQQGLGAFSNPNVAPGLFTTARTTGLAGLGTQAMVDCSNFVASPTSDPYQVQACAATNFLTNKCMTTTPQQSVVLGRLGTSQVAGTNCAGTEGQAVTNFNMGSQVTQTDPIFGGTSGLKTTAPAVVTPTCSTQNVVSTPAQRDLNICSKNADVAAITCSQTLSASVMTKNVPATCAQGTLIGSECQTPIKVKATITYFCPPGTQSTGIPGNCMDSAGRPTPAFQQSSCPAGLTLAGNFCTGTGVAPPICSDGSTPTNGYCIVRTVTSSWNDGCLAYEGSTPPPTTPPTGTPVPPGGGGTPGMPAPEGGGIPSPTDYASFTPSGPIVAHSGQIIENLHIATRNGPCIIVPPGVTNVIIRNNEIGPCTDVNPTVRGGLGDRGVYINGASAITVEHNVIHDVSTGVLAIEAHNPIVVTNNNMYNILGPLWAGQMVQYVRVNGGSGRSRITCNINDNQYYGAGPVRHARQEDHINIGASSGTSEAEPLEIAYNRIRGQASGGGQSGSGMMLGDGATTTSGHYYVHDNTIVQVANAGIGVAGGHDIRIVNNRVYNVGPNAASLTDAAFSVRNFQSNACYDVQLTGNQGIARKWAWNGTGQMITTLTNDGKCTITANSGNNFNATNLDASIFDQPYAQCN